MTAVTNDFTLELGASFGFSFVYTDASDVAIPLLNYTGTMQIRDCDDVLILEANTTNGYMTIHPSNGTITINIPKAIVLASTAVDNVGRNVRYDLFITSPTPDPVDTKLFVGKVPIVERITV